MGLMHVHRSMGVCCVSSSAARISGPWYHEFLTPHVAKWRSSSIVGCLDAWEVAKRVAKHFIFRLIRTVELD